MPISLSAKEPFLDFADTLKQKNQWSFSPWSTDDAELSQLAHTFFPEVPLISHQELHKPDITPVEIATLSYMHNEIQDSDTFFIAVGGPSAALVALEAALAKKRVLYVYDASSRPIWSGAGNHGEPDALTEAPAYTAGHQPLTFIFRELMYFLNPSFRGNIESPSYPWLSLNFKEWLKNPRQWRAGLTTALGNYQLYKKYKKELGSKQPPTILKTMHKRTHQSGEYLLELNEILNNELLRKPRGSLILAYTVKEWTSLLQNQLSLNHDAQVLKPLTLDEVNSGYGIQPENAIGYLEKTHDFIFQPNFFQKIVTAIKTAGGEVIDNSRLMKINIDPKSPHKGLLEFRNTQTNDHWDRYFDRVHLSLGATVYNPNPYPLISVTGVSMNALLIGANLKGGPIVCGGSNHIVPLCEPRKISLKNDDGTCSEQMVTIARLSNGATVGPLDRGQNWYHYNGHHALHLLHRVKETLPSSTKIRVLSVYGCNRVIGKDGHQVELHPSISINKQKTTCKNIVLQMGAGGGGLTQMGFLPHQIKKDHGFQAE